MVSEAIDKLQTILEKLPCQLYAIPEEEIAKKTSPTKWSKKEIIGHLIDSATNNHHRFVRGQFENKPAISYNQDLWNQYNFYQEIDSKQLISLWTAYNQQLLALFRLIPASNLDKKVLVGTQVYSLAFLISDYVVHLEHHIKQLLQSE